MGQHKRQKLEQGAAVASNSSWGPYVVTLLLTWIIQTSWSSYSRLDVTYAPPTNITPSIKQQETISTPARSNSTVTWPQHSITDNTAAAKRLIKWAESNGAVVNVAVRHSPQRGHYTVAKKALRKGDILVQMPIKLCIVLHPDGELVSGALLWRDLNDPHANLRPYLDTLPKWNDVMSHDRMPESYMPLIQNRAMENATRHLHQFTQQWYQHHKQSSNSIFSTMTLEDLLYGISLVRTRPFRSQHGPAMVPIIDLANHYNSCKNTLNGWAPELCKDGSPQGCLVWMAGTDIAAGAEVCNRYLRPEDMPQDQALLVYGFLQDDVDAKTLSMIDRHNWASEHPWHWIENIDFVNERDPDEIQAEISRLSTLLSNMKHLDETMQLKPDKKRDPDGWYLQLLLQWRVERQVAIAAELERLAALPYGKTQ